MINENDTWRRIAAFPLDDPGAPLPFSRRLARERGWDLHFTRRVLDEYRRFLFLAVEAGHPVSPSDAVDEAWHLHLLYTESYWTDLCQNTLGRPIHHGPTRGGTAEAAKFDDWYARTLASYCRLFGEEPPADIWPRVRPRASHPRRSETDLSAYWLVRRPHLPAGWLRRGAIGLGAAGAAFLLTGASDADAGSGAVLGALLGTGALVGLVAWMASGTPNGRRPDPRRSSGVGGDSSGGGGGDSGAYFFPGSGGDSHGHGDGHGNGHGGHGGDAGGDGGGGDGGGGDSGGGCGSGCGGGCGGGCGS